MKASDYMGVNIGSISLKDCTFYYLKKLDVSSIGFQDITTVNIEGCCFNSEVTAATNENGVHLKTNANVNFIKNNCYTEAEQAFIVGNSELPGAPSLYTNCHDCQPVEDCRNINLTKLQNLVNVQNIFYNVASGEEVAKMMEVYINAIKLTIKLEFCSFGGYTAPNGGVMYIKESNLT